MPNEEKDFFNSFGINPLCCQPETIGITKEKQLFTKWIYNFISTPNKKDIKQYMIYGNKKYSNYLWHSFSYEVLPTESAEDAPLCYSNIQKKKCFVLLINEKIAYIIENAAVLDVSILNKYDDIMIFDSDFSWTYCHTHEEYCGPYFYNKSNPPLPFDKDAVEVIINEEKSKYIEIFEKDGVFTYCIMQKLLEEYSYDNRNYYYWCPVDNKTSSFYDTKEKAVDKAKKLF